MNILLVEPDKLLAQIYAATLKSGGHAVVCAATAQNAIHAADIGVPDLVILELQLVSHSGIEFLYEFRSYTDWQTIPVIILSLVPPVEFSDSRDLLMTELGVQGYHYKPRVSLAKLQRLVQGYAAAEPAL